MLTAKQLEEIRERAEKATKGPWYFTVLGDCAQLSPVEKPKRIIGDLSIHDGRGNQYKNHISGEEGFANTAFIAHSRTDVPALLAEVERLRERNEKLERVAEAASGLLLQRLGYEQASLVGNFENMAVLKRYEEIAANDLANSISALDAEEQK
jgi:hypothetical protein